MFGKRKKTLSLKVFAVLLSFALTTVGFAADAGSARIIPSGKVSIIKDGKVVGEFSNEAPLPEGALLKCEGKCSVKLDDTYLVVESDTVFSVTPMADRHELFVHEGTVYYSLSESSRPLHFVTRAGDATTGDLNSADNEVRGYVRVTGNKTEIGVIGGGTMMIQTASGEMAVTPGKQITIAATGLATSGAAATETGGLTQNQKIALGVAGAAVLAGGAIAFAVSGGSSSGGGSGGGGGGSPAAP
jgi:hypothetical protein